MATTTKKGRKPAMPRDPEAPKETREQKLLRLSTQRVTKACNAIRLVGNLAAYKPTDPQVDKIMEALGESCARIDARMRGTRHDSITFTLQ